MKTHETMDSQVRSAATTSGAGSSQAGHRTDRQTGVTMKWLNGSGWRAAALWVAASLGLAAVAGCNESGDDIDRVQVNLVDKSMFQGEWWYANTIIDVDADEAAILGAGGLAPFEGSMSMVDFGVDKGSSFTMARIRWVIDEHFLYAYRAYELIDGGNEGGRGPTFRGQPLAAYPILAHVDIQRQYNPITGEPTNVIGENTTDRRWYDRQYMRVDWSMNLISPFYADYGPDFAQLFNVLRPEPVPFTFLRGAHADFPKSYEPQFVRVQDDPTYRFADEWTAADAGTVHYMSFVNQEIWSPGGNCLIFGGICSSAAVTVRSSFLRVPPRHEYHAEQQTHQEFDRFGLFRSYQRTYVRGGEDRSTVGIHCASDADCGDGGYCDTTRRMCDGGLSRDYGETDFLTFYRPRYNFFKNPLTDLACQADWQCDNRYGDGLSGAPGPGSQCDRAARRCTVPMRQRTDAEIRQVTYHLNPGFPAHLVRPAFQIFGDWNEAFVRGLRAARGRPAMDGSAVRIDPQTTDPTQYCWQSPDGTLKSPEIDADGKCDYKYDPFQTPEQAAALGVVEPIRCHVEGPAGPTHPTDYAEFADAYQHRMVGDECLLVLKVNSCDATPGARCEELGDIRYQFFNYIQHGAVQFGGVALPMMDPKNGELITSNVNMAGESIESIATTAAHFLPVLRGETSEDSYFTGEYVRGYFSRRGNTEVPAALANSGEDGYSVTDPSRPVLHPRDLHSAILDRMEAVAPRVEHLRGIEGRAQILGDRRRHLAGTDIEHRMLASIGREALPNQLDVAHLASDQLGVPYDRLATTSNVMAATSPFRNEFMRSVTAEERRNAILARMNIDPRLDARGILYNSQYWQYWADAFGSLGTSLDGNARNKEASIRMQQAFLRAVMYHEVGHAVGLRHNFAGSFDRNNYYDGFFNIAREIPLPYYGDYDEPRLGGNGDGQLNGQEINRWNRDLREARRQRQARGIGNTMGGSIMDYHGDLSDLSGLGRYDIAATMWNYFNVVEVYTEDRRVSSRNPTINGLIEADRAPRVAVVSWRGGDACREATDCPYGPGRSGSVPFAQRCLQNPRYTGGAALDCDGNRNCVCSSFDDDIQDYVFETPGASVFPVTYLFCGDERTNDLSWCNRFDAGESFQEVVDHWRNRWQDSYPATYFRNYRRGGARGGGTVGSIIDAAKIFQHLFFRYFYEPAFRSQTGPLGLDDQYTASIDVMNWFGEIVGLPDVGSYKLDPAANLYRRIAEVPGAPGADFSLLPGQGYHMWSAYQTGLNGFFRQERAGTFYDKYIAMLALAIRDWGLSFTLDERFYINFYDLFPLEMTDFFGGYIANDPRKFAPRVEIVDGQPRIKHLNWWRSNPRCGSSGVEPCRGTIEATYPEPALDGTSTELLRDWATILSLAEFPVFYDTSFEQRLMVFKLGNGDGWDIPATRPDGTPTCGFGEPGCTQPDYIRYSSDRLSTTFVAVYIRPRYDYNLPEEALGFNLLKEIREKQDRQRALAARPSRTPAEEEELARLNRQLASDDSFLEYLIDIQRRYGISAYFL
jgi:hypothetical protein